MCFGAEEHPAKDIAPKMQYIRQRVIVLSNAKLTDDEERAKPARIAVCG
jgi:hypothetical protein